MELVMSAVNLLKDKIYRCFGCAVLHIFNDLICPGFTKAEIVLIAAVVTKQVNKCFNSKGIVLGFTLAGNSDAFVCTVEYSDAEFFPVLSQSLSGRAV